jgi:anti-sigma B factor antagonist
MEMIRRDAGDVVVFDLEGELRGGPGDDATFKGGVHAAMDAGARKVLLNLRGLKWINSTGLGFIVAVYHDLQAAGGSLRMCAPNDRIAHIFSTTRFDRVIGIHASEGEALSAFTNGN